MKMIPEFTHVYFGGSVLLIVLVFCVVFLMGSVLLIVLVFCVVFFVLFFLVMCLVPSVSVVSGLSIIDCPFGFL